MAKSVLLTTGRLRRLTGSVNESLLDQAVLHGTYLDRFAQGEVNKVVRFLNKDVLPDLADGVEARLKRVKAGWTRGAKTTKRLRQVLANSNMELRAGIHAASGKVQEDLAGLALTEAQWQTRALRAATRGVGLDFHTPSPQRLRSILTSRPMEGALLGDWWQKVSQAAQRDIGQAISLGLAEGETVDKIVRRLVGTRAAAFGDGAFSTIRRNARATVRTAANHVSTHAREMTYGENQEVIKGVQLVATLDHRTTPMCMSYDGEVYPVDSGPRPPFHHQCRTTTVPVLRSWKELGIDLKEAPPGTRESMSGQVSAKTTYGQWLKRQPFGVQKEALGVNRARAFRAGRLNVKQLVDARGRTLTLKQLRTKLGLFTKDTKFREALKKTPKIRKISGPCDYPLQAPAPTIIPGGVGAPRGFPAWRKADSSGLQTYRGMKIDAQLDPKQMDKLNALRGITVTSTDAGHPIGTRSAQMAGDTPYAGTVFSVKDKDPERVAQKFRSLVSKDTKVDVNAWGGPHGNWVVYATDQGGWRNIPAFAKAGGPKAYPIDSVSVAVDTKIAASASNIAERHAWWERIIQDIGGLIGE